MTAPTQPPDPRVQRIADALDVWIDTVESHRRLARVLVEELGGRERETAKDLPSWYRLTWDKITDALTSIDPEWYHSRKDIGTHAADTIRTLAAQQRENAETIAALKGELKLARADRDFWKDEHNKACELAGQRAAELDAIKGAQRGVKFIAHNDVECTARFADGKYNITWQLGELGPMTLDAMYKTWPHLKAEERAALEALRHPAPALPVVGACVVRDNGAIGVYTLLSFRGQVECENDALIDAKHGGGKAYHLYRDVTPLSTEGGK